MIARAAQARASWEATLRTARLSTAERLVARARQLPSYVTGWNGAHVDLAELAAYSCVGVDIARAALDALTARGLVHPDAAGRLTLTMPTPVGGDAP
jgi:hypothetical protein